MYNCTHVYTHKINVAQTIMCIYTAFTFSEKGNANIREFKKQYLRKTGY